MTRRVTPARDQVDMLAPWREAGWHDNESSDPYHKVWFPGGERYVHERHLHAGTNGAARLRTASPMFDWRRSPEYDAPGISVDHHSAPLENGDRLHAYRLDFDAINPWVFEIEPHDMKPRLPLVFHDGVNGDLPRKAVPMAIARNPAVDPVGTDRTRRNFSLWGRRPDPDGGEHPGNWENGTSYTSLSEAVSAAEGRYLGAAPKWGAREPHQRAPFDYERFFNAPPGADDDFGEGR